MRIYGCVAAQGRVYADDEITLLVGVDVGDFTPRRIPAMRALQKRLPRKGWAYVGDAGPKELSIVVGRKRFDGPRALPEALAYLTKNPC